MVNTFTGNARSWHGTWRIADTVGCEKGRKGHKGQEGQSVFGGVGAVYIGISADYGSLAAFFFCTLCFCVIPGRLPTLYPVLLSFSSFSSFMSFSLPPPCALHNVLCQPPSPVHCFHQMHCTWLAVLTGSVPGDGDFMHLCRRNFRQCQGKNTVFQFGGNAGGIDFF